MDLSPLRKFEVLGPDAEELLQATRDARRAAARRGPGVVHGDVLRHRRHDRRRDAVPAGAGQLPLRGRRRLRRRLAPRAGGAASGLRVWVKPSTDELHNIAVQGPASRDILSGRHLDGADPDALRRTCAGSGSPSAGSAAPQGIPIVVSRTGYTGELGYELWCHPRDARGRVGRGLGGRSSRTA